MTNQSSLMFRVWRDVDCTDHDPSNSAWKTIWSNPQPQALQFFRNLDVSKLSSRDSVFNIDTNTSSFQSCSFLSEEVETINGYIFICHLIRLPSFSNHCNVYWWGRGWIQNYLKFITFVHNGPSICQEKIGYFTFTDICIIRMCCCLSVFITLDTFQYW